MPGPMNFGQVPVNPTTLGAQTLSFGFSNLQAQPTFSLQYGIDFTEGTPNCNANFTSCTLPVSFSPKYPGLRQDAVVVKDNTGSLLATAYLYGVGLGPQVAFVPGVVSTLAAADSSDTMNTSIAVDSNGIVYAADSYDQVVRRYTPGTSSPVIVAGVMNSSGPPSSGDGGLATNAHFDYIASIALDGAGNLFIVDGARSAS